MARNTPEQALRQRAWTQAATPGCPAAGLGHPGVGYPGVWLGRRPGIAAA
jgi:hypothetical protein